MNVTYKLQKGIIHNELNRLHKESVGCSYELVTEDPTC
jgi:hypothetical protein